MKSEVNEVVKDGIGSCVPTFALANVTDVPLEYAKDLASRLLVWRFEILVVLVAMLLVFVAMLVVFVAILVVSVAISVVCVATVDCRVVKLVDVDVRYTLLSKVPSDFTNSALLPPPVRTNLSAVIAPLIVFCT